MLSFVFVALVALAAGAGVVLVIKEAHSAGPQTASAAPSAGIRQGSIGPGPAGRPPPGAAAQIVLGGRVTGVSTD